MNIKVNVYTNEVTDKIAKDIERKLYRAGEIGRRMAYDKSRVKTSRMRNSTEVEVEKLGDELVLTLGQGNRQIHYAKFQELGTKFIKGTHQVKQGILRAAEEFKK